MNSRLIFNGRALARLMAATIGLALSVGAAPAQTAAQRDAIKSSCRSDYMANCMSVSPGGKEAFECLKNHYAALSAACKTAVDAIAPKPPPAAAAPPPPPAPKPALAAPKPPPAPPAPRPAAVAAPPPPPPAAAVDQNALRKHCRSDYRRHCASVPPGGREALACLQRNVNNLSRACRRLVSATMPVSAPPHAPPPRRAPPPPAAAAPPPPPPQPTISLARIDRLSLRERLRIVRACNQDQTVLCKGIRPGHSRLIECLALKVQSLSPFCRQTLVRALQ